MFVCSALDRAAEDTMLCSWARHYTHTAPLSTQAYKWVPVNIMRAITLGWTSIQIQVLQKAEIRATEIRGPRMSSYEGFTLYFN